MHSPPLGDDLPAKHPKVGEVTAKQAARFLGEAKDPFRAASLHPDWRPSYPPGEKIYRGTDTDNDRHAQRSIMHGHPFFLFRTAEADEQQVWACLLNAPLDFIVIHFQEWLVRWRIVTRDLEPGKLATQVGHCLTGGLW